MITLTYEDVYIDSWKLYHKLIYTGIEEPIIAPILRGGAYPGSIVASGFKRTTMPITYTTRHGERRDTLDEWIAAIAATPYFKPILLVDDLIDSGETLIKINEKLLYSGIENIYNCVLYKKPSSPMIDNLIYVRELQEDWIKFPWED